MPNIPANLRSKVRQRDHERCAYCHTPEELTVTQFEIDHIVPIRAGGQTVLENLCLACPACNRYKGSAELAQDPETGEFTPFFHPRLQKWVEHFEWNDSRVEIQGITSVGRAAVQTLRMNRPRMVSLRQLWIRMGYRIE